MSFPRSSDRPPRPAGRRPLAALLSSAAVVAGLLAVVTPAQAATFTVNSAADTDDGTCDASDCTLREAINAANGAAGEDSISFAIGSGPVTITVGSDLPVVTEKVYIDGRTQPGYAGVPLVEVDGHNVASGTGLYLAANGNQVLGMVINRFSLQQILIGESSSNYIQQNYLGTNAAGTAGLGGGSFGALRIRSSNSGPANTNGVYNNVIAGGPGVVLQASNGGSVSGSRVDGNQIGIGTDGGSLGSTGAGVVVSSTAGALATGNSIDNNMIAFNGGLGIDLGRDGVDTNDVNDADTGPNHKQNYPVLTGASSGPGGVTVSGTLDSTPSTNFRIELFVNQACDPSGFGEGERRDVFNFIDVMTDQSGHASFTSPTAPAPANFDAVTATATNNDEPTGAETSEFSACRTVTAAQPTPPSPPTGVSAGAGDSEAEVSWLAPDNSGSSPIDFYMVYPNPNPNEAGVFVDAPATTTTIGGLNNGTTYTFTVTATNQDGATSAPSDPSNSVTPQSGAAPPETTSADSPPNGNVSTGTTTNSSDPTNTSINTPNGGTVTIGESAMTGTPPSGVTYVGQQVDITAPDATANDPLTFTFITDCSVLPSNVSSCPVPVARATSGAAQPASALSSQAASAPSSSSVRVTDTGYTPNTTTIRQGGTVKWLFSGLQQHSVTDSRGLGASGAPLFNSGSKAPGTSYSHSFSAAGRYTYHSTVPGDTLGSGTVSVPVQVSQASGGAQSTIVITWASSRAAGYRFDVQYRYKAPGSSLYGSWLNWRSNTTLTAGQLVGGDIQGSGDYQFRSRLENSSTLKTTRWSVPATVTVSPRLSSVAVFHETESGNAELPDCIGPSGTVSPAPSCVWSEEILPDGDLKVVVLTTRNGRWRTGIV